MVMLAEDQTPSHIVPNSAAVKSMAWMMVLLPAFTAEKSAKTIIVVHTSF
jgi:hypothetical protein